jgi:uncharacterized repeat protein (TIGR02543 family)
MKRLLTPTARLKGAAVLAAAALVVALAACSNPTEDDKPVYHTLAFDSQGGTAVEPITAEEGTEVSEPAAPTKEGQVFLGWHDAASGGTAYSWPHTLAGDATLYAQWQEAPPQPSSFTVTFDKNGGDVDAVPATKTVTSPATTVDALPVRPTRDGHAFTGWNTAADGSGTPFAASTPVSGDIRVYAQWQEDTEPGSFTVTFDKNGGDADAVPTTKTVTSPATTIDALPVPPARTGYRFADWNAEADGSGTVFAATTPVNANARVYAQWTPVSYTVAYNANGGTGATAASSHAYDAAKALTANGFSRTGYGFAGWNAQADGSGASYTEGQSVTNLSAAEGATVTLSDQWTPVSYTVTFDKNVSAAAGSTPASSHVYDAAKALTANGFSRTGYAFAGWSAQTGGGGASYTDSQSVTNLSAVSGATVTLYARWTPISYTVAYDKNAADAAGTTAASSHTYGVAKALTANGFSRTGYDFAGWNAQAGGGGTSYPNGQSVTNLSAVDGATVTLYAQWTAAVPAITYPVAYDKNAPDATGTTASSSHTSGVAKALTANGFTRAGYAFAGWNTQADGAGTSYAAGQSVTNLSATNGATVTLYAQWALPQPPPSISIAIGVNNELIIIGGDTGRNVISKSGSPASLTLEADSRYREVTWHVDGDLATPHAGNSLTLNASEYEARPHSVAFTGKLGGVLYSQEIPFTVTN